MNTRGLPCVHRWSEKSGRRSRRPLGWLAQKLPWGSNTVSTRLLTLLLAALWSSSLWACTPTVQVQAPSEPITINLNIKHEITIKVDKDLEDLFEDDDELF